MRVATEYRAERFPMKPYGSYGDHDADIVTRLNELATEGWQLISMEWHDKPVWARIAWLSRSTTA